MPQLPCVSWEQPGNQLSLQQLPNIFRSLTERKPRKVCPLMPTGRFQIVSALPSKREAQLRQLRRVTYSSQFLRKEYARREYALCKICILASCPL